MAMQFKQTIEEYRALEVMQYGPYYYIYPPEEMLEGAKRLGCEEAYHNTNKIAEKCNVKLELGSYEFPTFNIKEAEDYLEFKQWQEKQK